MIELENSANLKDRIKYHAFLKEALIRATKFVGEWKDPHFKELEEKYVKRLKDRIANYDIYRQKVISRCRICNEIECVCYVLHPQSKIKSEITEQELDKLF